MIEYNYNITFCSIWNREQASVVTVSGEIDAINKSNAYSKLHSQEFLAAEFINKYGNSISFDELVVLYCKVW